MDETIKIKGIGTSKTKNYLIVVTCQNTREEEARQEQDKEREKRHPKGRKAGCRLLLVAVANSHKRKYLRRPIACSLRLATLPHAARPGTRRRHQFRGTTAPMCHVLSLSWATHMLAGGSGGKQVVAIGGDSHFFHSGYWHLHT